MWDVGSTIILILSSCCSHPMFRPMRLDIMALGSASLLAISLHIETTEVGRMLAQVRRLYSGMESKVRMGEGSEYTHLCERWLTV